MSPERLGLNRLQLPLAYFCFAMIGWALTIVPSLTRNLKAEFSLSDADLGLILPAMSVAFAIGAVGQGSARIGTRRLLSVAMVIAGTALVGQANAPSWVAFAICATMAAGGLGAANASINGSMMHLALVRGRRVISRLQVSYTVGALLSPLVIGQLLEREVGWRSFVGLTGLFVCAMAGPIRVTAAKPPRVSDAATPSSGVPEGSRGTPLALLGLSGAAACFVAAEAGFSFWLVSLLANETIGLATIGLALFWVGDGLGRFVAGQLVDRFAPEAIAPVAATMAAICIVGGTLTDGPLQLTLITMSGVCLGPVYPMVMTAAATMWPGQSARISGRLVAAGVLGAIVFPPLMGLLSTNVSLVAAMLSAALPAAAGGWLIRFVSPAGGARPA